MAEEIRLSWNSLMPYIEQLAAATEEKLKQGNNRRIKNMAMSWKLLQDEGGTRLFVFFKITIKVFFVMTIH